MTSPSSAPFRRLPLCRHLERERWFEGEGYEAMQVQGRRWSGDMGNRSDCRHEKLYVENVGATIIVLRKLSTEWRNYSAKISPDTLKVTLKHLRAKNEDALSRNTDPSQVASIKEADKYCKTILMKLTHNFGCMKGSVLVLVLGIASCSYCYLLSIPPMLRKYGFHLVLSGNRYYISDQVSNLRQHIKAVHQNLRPFACRFSKCGKKFPYKHVRDNHEKSGVHSYIQGDFLEIDEQWQSRPRGGRKRKCPSIESFCRKRIVSPEQASTLMYNVLRNMMQAEFCWWDEIE
ncbi:hypothetical protein ZIOFF_007522 [Zingiber officinale]|uniref:C2H2-type domain-containing protein n=1 Tax=Zingiber officinale TaxID=94328 RepID=A0A8J5HR09_ZINOF|nr:hypothetical protein ZIOFF_007522 [Zingiber officinale]